MSCPSRHSRPEARRATRISLNGFAVLRLDRGALRCGILLSVSASEFCSDLVAWFFFCISSSCQVILLPKTGPHTFYVVQARPLGACSCFDVKKVSQSHLECGLQPFSPVRGVKNATREACVCVSVVFFFFFFLSCVKRIKGTTRTQKSTPKLKCTRSAGRRRRAAPTTHGEASHSEAPRQRLHRPACLGELGHLSRTCAGSQDGAEAGTGVVRCRCCDGARREQHGWSSPEIATARRVTGRLVGRAKCGHPPATGCSGALPPRRQSAARVQAKR